MPCHHKLEEYLHAYIEVAEIATDTKGFSLPDSLQADRKADGKPDDSGPMYIE